LPTGIFRCQISQIWRFSKAFGSENYRLALNGEKRLATVFVTSSTFSKLECGPMPNVMAALPNIGGALCSTLQSLANAHY